VNSPRDRQQPVQAGPRKTSGAKSQLKQLMVEEMADRLDAKLNKQVIKGADKVARKAAHHLEHLDRLAAHLEVLDVWTRAEPGARRPRFSRETIAATAIGIADAEGFDAVSMRRIAADLDAGTMTLYHYVRTKDELLALVTDTLMAELVVPADEMPTEWRAAVTAIAHRSREMLLRHPWILDIADDPNIGPNSVRHFDQSLQAVSTLDVSLADKLDVMTVVDEYVFGYCLHERTNFHDGPGTISTELVDYVEELSTSGSYPQLAALIEEHGSHESWTMINSHSADAARFDRNLARILDGFEADFARRGGASQR
jgi:AcrR family transcriptional regulator